MKPSLSVYPLLSQTPRGRCLENVDADGALEMTDALGESRPQAAGFNFDEFFRTHYPPAARTIARVTGDAARAEDLAAEALWKLWRNPGAHGESAAGWLYRTAIRLALNELRGRERRRKYELLSPAGRAVATPEQVHAAAEEREQATLTLRNALDRLL